jgi:hypothetical protein
MRFLCVDSFIAASMIVSDFSFALEIGSPKDRQKQSRMLVTSRKKYIAANKRRVIFPSQPTLSTVEKPPARSRSNTHDDERALVRLNHATQSGQPGWYVDRHNV